MLCCLMVTDLHRVLHVFIGVTVYPAEEVHTQLWYDPFLTLLLLAHHRKRLAGSRLAVGEDADIVT